MSRIAYPCRRTQFSLAFKKDAPPETPLRLFFSFFAPMLFVTEFKRGYGCKLARSLLEN